MITDMTPFYPSLTYKDMDVVINELIQADAKLFGLIQKTTSKSLSTLVEAMNCYYSNMIEGF
jgi:hypothetical protein